MAGGLWSKRVWHLLTMKPELCLSQIPNETGTMYQLTIVLPLPSASALLEVGTGMEQCGRKNDDHTV